MKKLDSLEVLHFSTSHPGEFHHECEASFRLWRRIWQKSFGELQVSKTLSADDFLDREIGGLFLDGEPIGLILYRFFRASSEAHSHHSYFLPYSAGIRSRLKDLGENMMALSYLTVHEDWRKPQTDFPVAEALFSIANLRFLDSTADVCLGYARTDKKVHEILHRHGARSLGREQVYNVEVDFTSLSRAEARLSPIVGLSETIHQLWQNRNRARSATCPKPNQEWNL